MYKLCVCGVPRVMENMNQEDLDRLAGDGLGEETESV